MTLPVWPSNTPGKGEPLTTAHVPCKHQGSGGCAIYDTRPGPCAQYSCMWLLGWGADEDRPDRLGLLLEVNAREPDICFVNETRTGAVREPRASALLLAVRAQVPVVIVETFGGGEERLFMPGEDTWACTRRVRAELTGGKHSDIPVDNTMPPR